MSLEVRSAIREDFDAVSAVLRESYGKLLAQHYSALTLEAALPLITKARPELLESGTYYIALSKGTVVGCGGWTAYSPEGANSPNQAHIRHFATLPSVVRKGVGRALLRRCLADIRGLAFQDVECLSTRTAEQFYASEGFMRIAEISVALPGGVEFPAVRMTLRL